MVAGIEQKLRVYWDLMCINLACELRMNVKLKSLWPELVPSMRVKNKWKVQTQRIRSVLLKKKEYNFNSTLLFISQESSFFIITCNLQYLHVIRITTTAILFISWIFIFSLNNIFIDLCGWKGPPQIQSDYKIAPFL